MTARRTALVIGAGIAGMTTAVQLSRLGYDVTIAEKADGICAGASGNAAGSVKAFPGAAQDPLTMYYAAAYAYAQSFYARFPAPAAVQSGALDVRPGLIEKPERLTAIPGTELLSPQDIRRRFPGVRFDDGGAFFPDAYTVRPRDICALLLASCSVEMRFNTEAVRISHDGAPHMICRDGAVISADIIVACNAVSATLVGGDFPLLPFKGQISCYRTPEAPLPGVYSVHGGGYVARVPGEDITLIGATFEKDKNDNAVTLTADSENLQRARSFLPHIPHPATPVFSRASVRAALPDRRAIIGAVAGKPGLYINAGHGSRGLMSAPFAACIIANAVHKDGGYAPPFPDIAPNITKIVAPSRFAERAARKKRPRTYNV